MTSYIFQPFLRKMKLEGMKLQRRGMEVIMGNNHRKSQAENLEFRNAPN